MSEDHNQRSESDPAGLDAASLDDAPFQGSDVASMEDILASIRSMIAEDEAPAPVQLAPVKAAPMQVAPEVVESTANLARTEVAPLDMPFDLDSLLDPIDAPSDAPVAELDTTEISSMEALFEPPAPAKPEPAARDIGDTEDMDLVKSLMADLTEAPAVEALGVETPVVAAPAAELPVAEPSLAEVALQPEDILALNTHDVVEPLDLGPEEAVAEIPKVDAAAPAEPVSELSVEDGSSSFILDDIFEQSLADEEALNAAVELPELDEVADKVVAAESATAAPISAVAGAATAGGGALAAIAAQAEADAAALSGGEDLAATELVETAPQLTVIETPAPAPSVPAPPPASADLYQALEEEVMARNAPLEEIVADDVELEAGSAFAELNRLVEEKQEFQDRGPRIGDLVQEALKPMLKEWLDENLQAIVERAVQKEVKRIASGK